MKISKVQLKSIIKEELAAIKEARMSLDPHHSPGTAWKTGAGSGPELTGREDPNQAIQLVNDLKAIFRQFDAGVLTQPGNLELIKSKVDALINMSAGPRPSIDAGGPMG